jgi:hypothetical protein
MESLLECGKASPSCNPASFGVIASWNLGRCRKYSLDQRIPLNACAYMCLCVRVSPITATLACVPIFLVPLCSSSSSSSSNPPQKLILLLSTFLRTKEWCCSKTSFLLAKFLQLQNVLHLLPPSSPFVKAPGSLSL